MATNLYKVNIPINATGTYSINMYVPVPYGTVNIKVKDSSDQVIFNLDAPDSTDFGNFGLTSNIVISLNNLSDNNLCLIYEIDENAYIDNNNNILIQIEDICGIGEYNIPIHFEQIYECICDLDYQYTRYNSADIDTTIEFTTPCNVEGDIIRFYFQAGYVFDRIQFVYNDGVSDIPIFDSGKFSNYTECGLAQGIEWDNTYFANCLDATTCGAISDPSTVLMIGDLGQGAHVINQGTAIDEYVFGSANVNSVYVYNGLEETVDNSSLTCLTCTPLPSGPGSFVAHYGDAEADSFSTIVQNASAGTLPTPSNDYLLPISGSFICVEVEIDANMVGNTFKFIIDGRPCEGVTDIPNTFWSLMWKCETNIVCPNNVTIAGNSVCNEFGILTIDWQVFGSLSELINSNYVLSGPTGQLDSGSISGPNQGTSYADSFDVNNPQEGIYTITITRDGCEDISATLDFSYSPIDINLQLTSNGVPLSPDPSSPNILLACNNINNGIIDLNITNSGGETDHYCYRVIESGQPAPAYTCLPSGQTNIIIDTTLLNPEIHLIEVRFDDSLNLFDCAGVASVVINVGPCETPCILEEVEASIELVCSSDDLFIEVIIPALEGTWQIDIDDGGAVQDTILVTDPPVGSINWETSISLLSYYTPASLPPAIEVILTNTESAICEQRIVLPIDCPCFSGIDSTIEVCNNGSEVYAEIESCNDCTKLNYTATEPCVTNSCTNCAMYSQIPTIHQDLKTAIDTVISGGSATHTIKYYIFDAIETNTSGFPYLNSSNFSGSSRIPANYQSIINNAFLKYKELFECLFPGLTINISQLSSPSADMHIHFHHADIATLGNTAPNSNWYDGINSRNRIVISTFPNEAAPTSGNSFVDDADLISTPNSYSLLHTVIHELAHGFGITHSICSDDSAPHIMDDTLSLQTAFTPISLVDHQYLKTCLFKRYAI